VTRPPADGAVASNKNAPESNALQRPSNSSSTSTLDRLPQQASADRVADIPRAFDAALRRGAHETAETVVKQGIQNNPGDATLRRLLAQLLNAQGRRHEATEHVIHLIRLRAILPHELLSLIDRSGPFLLVTYDSIDFVGNDTLFGLGQARILYFAKRTDPDEILSVLNQVKEKHGHQPAVVAFTGRVLAETGRWEEFETWLQGLPSQPNQLLEIQAQPEYWHALGTWLSYRGQHKEAIRTWGEALRRDPTSRASLRSMIVTMENHVEHEGIGKLRTLLADLDRVFRIAKDADAQQAAWIAERFQSWVRPWEAAGWTMMAAQMSGQLQTIAPQLEQRRGELLSWEANATDQKIKDARLAATLGFAIEDFPLPDLHSGEPLIESNRLAQSDQPSPNKPNFSLKDVAANVGLRTRFNNDYPVEGGDFFLYQANGGGLAVLDYDLDGRCDLYLAQAGGSPKEPQSSRANQLFRLLPSQTFEETTVQSSTGDRGYSQGICVGDVNQDGFPDLLIANIGSNSFYVNQGDGTFVQASERIQPHWASDSEIANWTSSLGLADLDGDGLPELVEVNYINDPTAFQSRCTDPYDNCQPQDFSPCADRVYRMQPDGTLKLWPSVTQAMSEIPKYGFGLVIADFDQSCGNDFFISNDGDLNHLWSSQCPSSTPQDTASLPKQPLAAEIQLAETAGLAGCAVGRNGDSQACMGVASGDFNRDGKLDLHVTNFYKEPVNLFIQTAPGFFSDEALSYRLYQPSFDVLGWGTQSADFDNDGWLDIAVLNGHLYDRSSQNIPYKMLPQLFTGSAVGFQLQEAKSLGKYWERPQLGRTLAMLDWNRDGRMDLLANSLDSDIALLQNDSHPSTPSNWIQFELVGLDCERDAIGAVVEVEAHDANNKQTLFGWQVGGDGYMCTNEQVIHVGLGGLGSIDQIRIRWPNGNIQSLDQAVPRHRYLVVENEAIFSR
jgi:tetratricopeptide (TPR) repeat protein